MGIIWALALWFIAAAVISIFEIKENTYKGKKKKSTKPISNTVTPPLNSDKFYKDYKESNIKFVLIAIWIVMLLGMISVLILKIFIKEV